METFQFSQLLGAKSVNVTDYFYLCLIINVRYITL